MGFQSSTLLFFLPLATSFSLVFQLVVLANSLIHLQDPHTLCHDQERFALLQFKQSFFIDCTLISPTSYPKAKFWGEPSFDDHLVNGTSTINCCMWDGVKCNELTGHVIGLDLSNSCLSGTFPLNSTLFTLDHLIELNLAHNHFNFSRIPAAIGRLSKLTSLNLSASFFSDEIPSEVSQLSSLLVLDLSYNGDSPRGSHRLLTLRGMSLEKFVHNLTHLSELHLDYVDIDSTFPVILSNLTFLRSITLSGCNLFGEVQLSLFGLPNLEKIALDGNLELQGMLPEFRVGSPLRYINLNSTKFSGELPPSLGNLGSLNVLDITFCFFSGSIPSSLGDLKNLTHLDLSFNNFRGDLPSSVTNLTKLNTLCLSQLNINLKTFEPWLLKQSSLTRLVLSQFNLGGNIPPVLANLTRLTFLDLDYCKLSGPIPNWLANFTQLTFLSLFGNQFYGPIPSWISLLTNLQTLFLSFQDSVGTFNMFLKLPHLKYLALSGVNLTFDQQASANSPAVKFDLLTLQSCNFKEFPLFLRDQDELQGLSLKNNSIKGDIPLWFVNITRNNLLALDLSYNNLTGFEKHSVFLPWPNLQVLDVSENKMSGIIPTPLNSMQFYKVSNNQFSGVITNHICNASSLRVLDLSNNNLNGKIPRCINRLFGNSLQVLNLRNNNFSGPIPKKFPRSCQLKMINLSQNRLQGKVPKSLANCKMLEVLDIGTNHVNDNFPSWLGNLSHLEVLVLRHNNFFGTIPTPSSTHDFPSLRILDLSHNFHTGNMPSEYLQNWPAMRDSTEDESYSSNFTVRIHLIFSHMTFIQEERYNYVITISNKGSETFYSRILTVFRVIDFSSNNFSGEIPGSIGELRGLQAVNLSYNNLEGGIPASLANIRDIESLDLSQNKLSGKIPRELTQLTSLEIFNVSHNHLVGPIPEGEQFNTFENSSFDGNLALCGPPLSRKCENDLPSSDPVKADEEIRNDSMLVDWIIRSLGCASGLIVGFATAKIYITDRHNEWFMETFGGGSKSKKKFRIAASSHYRNS